MSEKNKTRALVTRMRMQSSIDPLARSYVHMGLKKEYKLVNKNILQIF